MGWLTAVPNLNLKNSSGVLRWLPKLFTFFVNNLKGKKWFVKRSILLVEQFRLSFNQIFSFNANFLITVAQCTQSFPYFIAQHPKMLERSKVISLSIIYCSTFSFTYFPPRRGYPRVLKFCIGL